MTDLLINVAVPEDRDRAAALATTAFVADPFLRLMLPGDDDYAEHAPAFFGALYDKRVGVGTVWFAGDYAAVAMWDAPGVETEAVFDLPESALRVLAEYDEQVHAAFPDTRYWYLGVLASDPANAGQGLGRAVMRAGLGRAAAEGMPAYLETTNPRNVELYTRAGWHVETELERPLPVWVMRQDPA